MEMRSAGRVKRIGFVLLAFALAFLACGAAYASDVERRIPMIRDIAGSGLTMEISREGTRRTAAPSLTLYSPTVRRIEDRIGKTIDRMAAKETPSGATAAGSPSRIGLAGTPREDSGEPETALSSLSPASGEITVRSARSFAKGLRASRKEKAAPAVAVAVAELRLGMVDAAPR